MKIPTLNFPYIIKELQEQRSQFAISLYMPTAQMIPDKLQDRIRLKDLVAKALKQLKDQHPERDFKDVADRIESLVEEYDFAVESKGLALFVSQSFGRLFRLPFSVAEQVTVDAHFNTVPLTRELAHTNHYLVLELTKKMCRLYEAYNTHLKEIVTPEVEALGNPLQGFPLDYIEPEDKYATSVGQGDRDVRYLDDHEKRYFAMVDTELGKVLNEHPLPVVVCGSEKNIGMFRAHTKHGSVIVGYQHGDYRNSLDLAQAVQPILEKHHRAQTEKLLKDFVESEGSLQQAFGLKRVWQMARAGRVQYLLVEEGLVRPGVVDFTNLDHLICHDKLAPEKQIGNLVDAVIGRVIETRGKVIFVPKDTLKDFEHMGAILRY